MNIYITSDGTWGNANDLILVSESDLSGHALDLYMSLWDGGDDGVELYNHLKDEGL